MIDKSSLLEYNDLCEQVVETEQQLERLVKARSEVLHDSVKGSNPEYPYEPITFHIAGIANRVNDADITKMRHILTERRDAAKDKRIEVETWLNTIPVRMQRIVRLKFFEGKTWGEVAMRSGWKNGDAIRKEFWNFFDKENN